MIRENLKQNYKHLIILFILMVFFCLLSKMNNFAIFNNIDQSVSNLIKECFDVKYDKLFNFTSDFIGIYTLIFIIMCMFICFKKKYYFLLSSFGYMFTLFISIISKILISRTRPIIEVKATIDAYSFPSGHTMTAFVGYYFIAYLMSFNTDKRTKIAYYLIATILVTTVAFSRLYLGVHFFTDVIGGIIFGSVVLSMLINIVNKNFKRKLV